ncbi:MAG: heme ABC transporter ATP-binding protein [Leeuwenhoekiella sp.]
MILAKNINYSIKKKVILQDISVSFIPGKLNLIIGPNGAGKSTLINIICNQIKPDSGEIFYDDKNMLNLSVSQLAQVRAVLSQNVELAFPLKVSEVVMMGRYPHFQVKPTAKDVQACEEAMRFFDVWEMADRNYMTLSGGEKQRVHFARVIAQIWYAESAACRYLILDEPLTFLDVHYQFHFMRKLQELLKQKNIVIVGVVHDLNLAAKFADQIVLLKDGKVLAAGNRNEVLTKANIKAAYRLDPVIHKDEKGMFFFFE